MANLITVEEAFRDWEGRRAGLIKGLTTEADDLYELCDPEDMNLCLYGMPNEEWELNIPAVELPPELPEPTVGINFAREGMPKRNWLKLVAVHSDAWLFAVVFYLALMNHFDRDEREVLFDMINEFPTIYEVVVAYQADNAEDTEPSEDGDDDNDDDDSDNDDDGNDADEEEEEVDEDDDDGDDPDANGNPCECCGRMVASNDFWICCDICETWYHNECGNATPIIPQYIMEYTCPSCGHKIAVDIINCKYQDLPLYQREISCWMIFTKCLFD